MREDSKDMLESKLYKEYDAAVTAETKRMDQECVAPMPFSVERALTLALQVH